MQGHPPYNKLNFPIPFNYSLNFNKQKILNLTKAKPGSKLETRSGHNLIYI